MSVTRTSRRASRHAARASKRVRPAAKPARKLKVIVPQPQMMYRLCKAGWAVIVEKTPNAQGTRFVCPFCPVSHRVPGPVRGFRRMRRAQWVKLRRVGE
ncbi:MAG TPA: hypothetical protein VNF02_04535 [Candidatus Limnocylindrales bacterium]|jgi:hypothetical protein|nr:hypothetical protein [Candidatus Limnocylindrales bacterium]